MAIEKPMSPANTNQEDTVQVEVINPEAVTISTEDEATVIDFTGEMAEELLMPEHDANLVEFIEDGDLQNMASELVDDFDSDRGIFILIPQRNSR